MVSFKMYSPMVWMWIICLLYLPVDKISTSDPAELPEGVLAFLTTRDGNFEVYTMNLDGNDLKNLTQNPSVDYGATWSPDAKYIMFYSDRDGNKEIYRMNADGTHQVRITDHPKDDYIPSWSPDGKKIVFTSDRDHPKREIYSMNPDGSDIIRLTHNEDFEESPSWSPDGHQILFTRQIREDSDSSHAGNGEIFIMDADGRNEKRLTHKAGFDSGAVFSPDGSKIAFYGLSAEDNWELFIMNPDGSDVTNLTRDEREDYSPAWSPDGQWIAYCSGTPAQYDVWVIHVASGTKHRLTTTPKRNQSPVWKPR